MSVFIKYSPYYDLLYKDKDYVGEAAYVHGLIQKHSPNAKTIIELGCGTGHHAEHLAKLGYHIHGVDLSDQMLEFAQYRLKNIPSEFKERLSFSHGDVRYIRLQRQFDVVISLFHVMSYQVSNTDLSAAFATARQHLKSSGVFIFDCWYGPAVLTFRPVVRIKRLEDEAIGITRIAEPMMHPDENLVDVNYHVFIKNKASGEVEDFKETHRMRYMFTPEIKWMLRAEGLKFISAEEWVTGKDPGFDTWYVCFVAQA